MSRLHRTLLGGLLLLLATAVNAGDLSSIHLGGDTIVTTPENGDRVYLGHKIDVQAEIHGNLVATASEVNVQRAISGDLYAAGRHITLGAPVTGSARIFGRQVEISPEARIQGEASLAGGSIHLRAPVGGKLEIGGEDMLIDSSVAGDVEAAGEHLTLGPNARIAGRLRYAGPHELARDPAAEVHGSIEHTTRHVGWSRNFSNGGPWSWRSDDGDTDSDQGWNMDGWPYQGMPFMGGWHRWTHPYRAYGMGFTGGLAVLTALLIGALLPGLAQRLAATVSAQWGSSVLTGLVVLVGTPIVAVILCITLIGIPVALVLMAAWGILIFLGYAASGVAFGELALYRLAPARYPEAAMRVIAAALAMIVVIIAARAPLVGGLVSIIATLTGIGALLIAWRGGTPAARPA
jgi:hypothetical protein